MLRKMFLHINLPDDAEEDVLVGLADQLPPASNRKSGRESQDAEEILNLLKTGNEWLQKTLELIGGICSASTPDFKRSWGLCMVASVKNIHPSLWRSIHHQSYQMMAQYLDQSAAIQQGTDGQSPQQNNLFTVLILNSVSFVHFVS